MAWDTMGVVMEVGKASAEDSTSLSVLGERMETGWEHRTLCKERREMEAFSKEQPLLPQQVPQSPSIRSCAWTLWRQWKGIMTAFPHLSSFLHSE